MHAAVLDAIERESDDDDASEERTLLRALETGDDFDHEQLRLLRRIVSTYLDDAPSRDGRPGRAALRDIELALA